MRNLPAGSDVSASAVRPGLRRLVLPGTVQVGAGGPPLHDLA